MKKFTVLILLIIAVSLFFVFFPKTQKDTREEVSFYTLQMGTFADYINGVIYEFERENPGVKIKWVDVPYSEGEKRALASILSDNPPDIINLTPDFSLSLAQKNALMFIREQDLEQFNPALLKSVKYDESYYAFPFYATSAVTVYNEDLISHDIIPATYRELFELCKEYDKEGSYLTMISFNENDTLLKILNKYGITTPEDLLTEDSRELFGQLRQLYKDGKLPKESITQSHREGLEKFMSGQLALLNVGVNFINIIKENAPQIYEKTHVSFQLSSEDGEFDYSLMNFVIPKKAKHKENAVKFILFLTNRDNQLELSKLTSVLSTNEEALRDDFFALNADDLMSEGRYISSAQLNNPIEPVKIQKNRKEIISLSSEFIQKVLLTDEDIDSLLRDFSQKWKKLEL